MTWHFKTCAKCTTAVHHGGKICVRKLILPSCSQFFKIHLYVSVLYLYAYIWLFTLMSSVVAYIFVLNYCSFWTKRKRAQIDIGKWAGYIEKATTISYIKKTTTIRETFDFARAKALSHIDISRRQQQLCAVGSVRRSLSSSAGTRPSSWAGISAELELEVATVTPEAVRLASQHRTGLPGERHFIQCCPNFGRPLEGGRPEGHAGPQVQRGGGGGAREAALPLYSHTLWNVVFVIPNPKPSYVFQLIN